MCENLKTDIMTIKQPEAGKPACVQSSSQRPASQHVAHVCSCAPPAVSASSRQSDSRGAVCNCIANHKSSITVPWNRTACHGSVPHAMEPYRMLWNHTACHGTVPHAMEPYRKYVQEYTQYVPRPKTGKSSSTSHHHQQHPSMLSVASIPGSPSSGSSPIYKPV